LDKIRYPFLSQEDRMDFFKDCMEAWMVPCWLLLGAGRMINVRWLYQKTELTDPNLQPLRTTLLTVLEERFLQLVDATYCFMIARCFDGLKPENDLGSLGKEEVNGTIPSLDYLYVGHC
jgi:hypothetical protein